MEERGEKRSLVLARKLHCCCWSCCYCWCCTCCLWCCEGEARWEVHLEDCQITGLSLSNSLWIRLWGPSCGWQGGEAVVLLPGSLKYEMNSVVVLLSSRMCRCSHSGSPTLCACTVAPPPPPRWRMLFWKINEIPLRCMNFWWGWGDGGLEGWGNKEGGWYQTDTSVLHFCSCSLARCRNQTVKWQTTLIIKYTESGLACTTSNFKHENK